MNRPNVTELLLAWYRQGHRDLPWRRTGDPYRIWISEIMLQQTRAQAAVPYYERFLERFPAVEALAQSREADVLAAWSGLGYYERARNLRRAAQRIAAAGEFPRDYDAIRALPGIGDYTAAAIASIAFGLPHAVVDGNVLRVVARIENDASEIGSSRTRRRFREIAQSWLDPGDPGAFNQALMELGATVCLPRNPLCLLCPVAAVCRGLAEATVEQLPVKLRRVDPVAIESLLLIVRKNGRILLRQREPDSRRMAGFWELPTPDQLPRARVGRRLGAFRHTITHHHYTFGVAEASDAAARRPFRWHEPRLLTEIPLSTTARKALRVAGIIES
ncbi:MAG TPA: A/G-specific adenine glycosylase [Bryobacteraceae bacterium]|nr:A/G-specific adenine glycosylase [Bryobacteraceae bacterium]